jgi:serine/threonine-protein kinase
MSTSPPNELQPGRVLVDRYELIRLAGSGGMAQVWEATDRVLGRRVAIKLLHSHLASDSSIARFRQEGIAAAKLIHPNVVSIFDTIPVGESEALVMEFVEGHSLRAHLDRHGTISESDTRLIGIAIAEALGAAHRQGLVHRDVKPANILLCRNGQVKITDFGIAKAAEADGLTREGTLVGTAAYLAPEQLDGSPVDGRADIYALGLVLYECLAGQPAFSGETDAVVALARLRTEPTPVSKLNSAVTPVMESVIRRAMMRDPERRFTDAAQLRGALSERSTAPPSQGANAAGLPPAPVPPKVHSHDDETSVHDEPVRSLRTSSDRRWMVPAAVAVTVLASLLIVAALLSDPGGKKPGPTPTVPEGPLQTLAIAAAYSVDPFGDQNERDDLLDFSADGDPNSAWQTEGYDNGFEGVGKAGVGIAWALDASRTVADVTIDSPETGWSASIYVLTGADAELFEPSATPAAVIENWPGGAKTVELKPTRGQTVLLWFTHLGSSPRIKVIEVSIRGTDG